MAGRVASIFAEIGLKTDKFDAGITKVKGGLTKAGNEFKTFGSKINQFGKGLDAGIQQVTGFSLAQIGAVGTVGLMVKGVSDALSRLLGRCRRCR